MSSDSIELALLAVMATVAGDADAALTNIAAAQRQSRSSARRHRQVVEIAALVVARRGQRAGDLALVHVAEFPGDAALLAQLVNPPQTA
jgi:hypothetical protein